MALAVKAVGSRHATRGAWRGVVAALPVVKTHNAGGIRLRPTQHIVAQMPHVSVGESSIDVACGLKLGVGTCSLDITPNIADEARP